MNKEFIPYEQALELKELGFDEECVAYYHTTLSSSNVDLVLGKTHNRFYYLVGIPEHFNTLAPLYQQAFRWFREKYSLQTYIDFYHKDSFFYKIKSQIGKEISSTTGNVILQGTPTFTRSYEEAELACLKKLIELVKKA
jgi:hypothetical protein